jgi:hypothetical protein
MEQDLRGWCVAVVLRIRFDFLLLALTNAALDRLNHIADERKSISITVSVRAHRNSNAPLLRLFALTAKDGESWS